jgi:hypothetical protein
MKEEKYINGRNGPKPLGDEPMTPAERKRRSRLKLKQDGGKEYQVKINKKQLQAIKHYSKLKQTKTNQNLTIKILLQEALEHISGVMSEVDKMNDDDDKNHNDMMMYIHTYLFPNPTKK